MGETFQVSLGLPDAENVRQNLLAYHDYDPLTKDFEALRKCFDFIAPVQLDYIPTNVPAEGEAPEHIRQQWVGLQLPVRCKAFTEEFGEGFVVRAREAYEILRQERPEAHAWWREYYIGTRKQANAEKIAQYKTIYQQPYPKAAAVPENPDFPEYGVNASWFIFDPTEGLVSPRPQYRNSLILGEALVRNLR